MNEGFRSGSLCFMLLLLIGQALFSQTPETVTIIGTGDMMLGTNYPNKSYLPANGGRDLLRDVVDILKNADVTFGNLEGCMFDGSGTPKRCRDMSKCYVFRSPASFVNHFVNAGYDVVSLANNHSGDFGLAGRKGTKKVLDEAGIAYAGLASTDESAVFERNGVKYGFAAFAPNSGTCDVRNLSRAKQIVSDLASKCDIVIVSFHGGAEGKDHQHVPKKTEYYLGENRGDVHAFAHAVIDAGADVVFGHGPHVTRAVELYKGRFIAYSLGNFCTYGRFNLRGPAGVAPIIKVHASKSGEFVKAEVISTYQQKTHGPKPDPQNRALKIIQELTRTDFPEAKLTISDDGLILPKE
ncbi:MAG: capsule biosynthesis protein CapA [Saprospirales bacterium]|nr:capsule biosynthesis protein CapA [Saprospirales bacterium]